MAQREQALEALLSEDRTFAPAEAFRAQSNAPDPAIHERAAADAEAFWAEWASQLDWYEPWQKVLDWQPPHAKWFVGGKLNVAYNCVDRHLDGPRRNKAALIWEGEPGEMRPGDRIVFYLTGDVQFGGIVEVTSEMYEDDADIGLRSEAKEMEDYPYRVKTKPVVIPPAGRYVEVREITDLLDKTRALGPKKLGMAFRGNLHRISDADYAQIEQLLKAEAGAAA